LKKENSIVLFNQIKVRQHWDEDQELWYFSIVDVVATLTDSVNPQAYWRKLKERLKKEGNESVNLIAAGAAWSCFTCLNRPG